MSRYRVKFTDNTGTHFGVVDNYSDEAKAAKQQGNVLVDDAVYPKCYLVPESLIVDVPYHLPKFVDRGIEEGQFRGFREGR